MPRPSNQFLQERSELLDQGLRRCSACNEIKKVGEFGRSTASSDGILNRCKVCVNQANRTYPENRDPEKRKKSSQAGSVRQWERVKGDPEAREKARQRSAEWARKHPLHRSIRGRARKYGIPYDEVFHHLCTPCNICGGTADEIDHCHETGKVRGGLCNKCNKILGLAGDSPQLLQAAIDYLVP